MDTLQKFTTLCECELFVIYSYNRRVKASFNLVDRSGPAEDFRASANYGAPSFISAGSAPVCYPVKIL